MKSKSKCRKSTENVRKQWSMCRLDDSVQFIRLTIWNSCLCGLSKQNHVFCICYWNRLWKFDLFSKIGHKNQGNCLLVGVSSAVLERLFECFPIHCRGNNKYDEDKHRWSKRNEITEEIQPWIVRYFYASRQQWNDKTR